MNKIAIIFVISLLSFNAFAVGKGRMILTGNPGSNKVELMWMAYGWPDDLMSFNIKRRIQGESSWVKLNQNPISPAISQTRNWSDMGLNDKQTKHYSALLNTKLEQGKFTKEFSAAEFYKMNQKRGMSSGDRIKFKTDYANAVMLGFAYIDNSYRQEAEIVYEYGLFGVSEGGTEATKPLATYTTLFYDVTKYPIDFTAVDDDWYVKLSWSAPVELKEKFNFLKFNLYRKEKKSDNWTEIDNPAYLNKLKNNKYHGQKVDKDAEYNKSYYFAIAPVNNFGVVM